MRRRTFYGFIISFLLLVAVVVFSRLSFKKIQDYSGLVDHTRVVITELENLSDNLKSAQIYTPSYQDTVPAYYELYQINMETIPGILVDLKDLVSDNKLQSERIDSLNRMISEELPVLRVKNIAEIIQAGEPWRLQRLLFIHQMIDRAIDHEKDLLAIRKTDLDRSVNSNNMFVLLFTVLAVGIIAFTFISLVFISRKRQWLENFLQSVLNTSQDGIIYFKAVRNSEEITDLKIDYANKAVMQVTGFRVEALVGRSLKSLPHFFSASEVVERYMEVLKTGKSTVFEFHYQNPSLDKWLLVSVVRLGDGVTATMHDISSIKESQEQLQKSIIQLERSNTELEQYAYVASHDLQEPLRKIRSYGSFLQETQKDRLDQKGREQLNKILGAAERMANLIRDLLHLSSLKKDINFTPTDLNEILGNVLHDLDLLISQKEALIESEKLPVIDALQLQMTQLFYNLINNSLKFSKPDQKPVIRISCTRLDHVRIKELLLPFPNERYYEIIFKDNGIGFSGQYSEQIFGMFKRLNNQGTYPGSGIGLALCKKVTLNHGGVIFAKGEDGEGAEFHVVLPEKQFSGKPSGNHF